MGALTVFFPSHAVHTVRVVTHINQSMSSVAPCVKEAVGAGAEQGLAPVAPGRLVVEVAVFLVSLCTGLAPAVLVKDLVGAGSRSLSGAGSVVLLGIATLNIVVWIVLNEALGLKLFCWDI